MSSETKSRAGRDWITDLDDLCTTMAYHTLPFKDRAGAFERFLNRYRESLESSSSADAGGRVTTQSVQAAERLLKEVAQHRSMNPDNQYAQAIKRLASTEDIEVVARQILALRSADAGTTGAEGPAAVIARGDGCSKCGYAHIALDAYGIEKGVGGHYDVPYRIGILGERLAEAEIAATQRAPVTPPDEALERLDEQWKARCRVLMGDVDRLKAQADLRDEALKLVEEYRQSHREVGQCDAEPCEKCVRAEALAAEKEPRG